VEDHVVGMGELRNTERIFVGTLKERNQLGDQGIWKDHIKMDPHYVGYWGVNWICRA
jgi:hypothetical protein